MDVPQRRARWSGNLIRQPSAVNVGVMLACLVYAWLIPGTQSLGSIVRAGSGIVAGFVAPIAGLALYYESQGNLHDAYLWAWVLAIRYVESETTLLYVLEHLVMIYFSVLLSWGLLWYFGIRQVIVSLKSLRHTTTGSTHGSAACFVARRDLSDNLYWVAVSGALSSDGASTAVDSRRTSLLSLRRAAAASSSQEQWRCVRIGIIGAAAVPIARFLYHGVRIA